MPPSTYTSARSPTASTTPASASSGTGARSSWRPPWFETTTASAPASTTARASSTCWTPLTTSDPGHTERSQARSDIVTDGSNIRPTRSATVPSEWVSDANSRGSVVSRSNHQAGCRTPSAKVRADREGGIVRPLRTSRRRARNRRVDGKHQCFVAGLASPFDEVPPRLPVTPEVELEPESCAGGRSGEVLDRGGAHRGQRVRDPGAVRHPGDRGLARGVHHPGEAGGREDERQGRPPPEDRRRRVHVGDVPKHPGPELHPREGLPGPTQADLLAGSTVGVVEDRAGGPAPGQQPKVRHRGGPGQAALRGVELQPGRAEEGSQLRPARRAPGGPSRVLHDRSGCREATTFVHRRPGPSGARVERRFTRGHFSAGGRDGRRCW